MAQIDPIVATSGNVTITGQGYANSTSFYQCAQCGTLVWGNGPHVCIRTNSTVGYQCYRCGQWVAGVAHDCRPPITVGTFYPPVAPIMSPFACNHCRCIDVPPSGERTKLHKKCCVCGDTRVAEE